MNTIQIIYQPKDYLPDIIRKISQLRLTKTSLSSFYFFLSNLYYRSSSNRNWNLNHEIFQSFIKIISISSQERCNILKYSTCFHDKDDCLHLIYKSLEIIFKVNPSLVVNGKVFELLIFDYPNYFKYHLLKMLINTGYNPKDDKGLNSNNNWISELEDQDEIIYSSKIIELLIRKEYQFKWNTIYLLKSSKNISLLLDYQFIPDTTDELINTPLHVIYNHSRNFDILSTVKCFLEKGANPNFQNIDGDTPLHYHIRYNIYTLHPRFFQILDIMVQNGADLNILNFDGKDILNTLKNNHHENKTILGNIKKIVKGLTKRGFNINKSNIGNGVSYHILKILLDCGLDPNFENEEGLTLPFTFIDELFEGERDENEILNSIYLLQHYNCNYNHLLSNGDNLFHYILKISSLDQNPILFKMLYDFNVSLTTKNNHSKTPLDYASSIDYFFMFEYAVSTKRYSLLDDLLSSKTTESLEELLHHFQEIDIERIIINRIREYISLRNQAVVAVLDRFICQDVLRYVVNKFCYP